MRLRFRGFLFQQLTFPVQHPRLCGFGFSFWHHVFLLIEAREQRKPQRIVGGQFGQATRRHNRFVEIPTISISMGEVMDRFCIVWIEGANRLVGGNCFVGIAIAESVIRLVVHNL